MLKITQDLTPINFLKGCWRPGEEGKYFEKSFSSSRKSPKQGQQELIHAAAHTAHAAHAARHGGSAFVVRFFSDHALGGQEQ